MKILNGFFVLMASLAMLTGCSSKPTLGDAMLQKGVTAQELGNQWNDGNDLVNKGRKMIKQGQEKISDGEEIIEEGHEEINDGKAMIKKGNRLVEQGTQKMQDSEDLFKVKFPNKQLIVK